MSTRLFIKNMVCKRCIIAVRKVLEDEHLTITDIRLGEAEIRETMSAGQLEAIGQHLKELGFERIDDRKGRIIEKIKNTIVHLVHHQENNLEVNLSDLLSRELHLEYHYLSTLFSDVEGVTIEKYFIAQKIEKVKELLVYDELTLSQIAHLMNYSSVAHLSRQFKKVTGLTPTHFKNIKADKRKSLDDI